MRRGGYHAWDDGHICVQGVWRRRRLWNRLWDLIWRLDAVDFRPELHALRWGVCGHNQALDAARWRRHSRTLARQSSNSRSLPR